MGHVLVFHGSVEDNDSGLHRLQGDHVFFRILMSVGYNLNGANSSGQPPRKIKALYKQRHNPIFTKTLFKKRINRNGKVKLIQIRNL